MPITEIGEDPSKVRVRDYMGINALVRHTHEMAVRQLPVEFNRGRGNALYAVLIDRAHLIINLS